MPQGCLHEDGSLPELARDCEIADTMGPRAGAICALFAAEAKFVSHGVLTIGGIALLTLGALLLVDSPIPEMRVHLATALAVSIPLGVITALLMTIALRARRNKIVTGEQGLVGETGVVQTALSPQGKVFVHGELWDAVGSASLWSRKKRFSSRTLSRSRAASSVRSVWRKTWVETALI